MASFPTLAAGFGLRQPHFAEVLEGLPLQGQGAWVEVHSENFFSSTPGQLAGGPALATLLAARQHYPVSLHGVGLSLGTPGGVRAEHLASLQALAGAVEPWMVSEHLCWGSLGAQPDAPHLNDLLPLPHTAEALAVVCANVQRVQDALKRPIAVENVSAYLRFAHSEMSEFDLLAELVHRTGCHVLLDVNNLYVNQLNHGTAAVAEWRKLPRQCVAEMHLAGHTETQGLVIDTHGAPVCAEVWALYEQALQDFGPTPTLVEWDTDLPPLATLLAEVARANQALNRLHTKETHAHLECAA
jgi:uncharacterized protein (UPF0276 family)